MTADFDSGISRNLADHSLIQRRFHKNGRDSGCANRVNHRLSSFHTNPANFLSRPAGRADRAETERLTKIPKRVMVSY